MSFEKYKKCVLCPRECAVDRTLEKKGFCGESAVLRLGRAALHFWEEPCISGKRGSGTVFFSGCNLKCCYCQNFKLSRNEEGICLEEKSLEEIFLNLQRQGAHNINLVTGEHFAPHIKEAVLLARENGLKIPVILNSNGYVTEETLDYLKDVIDIYLVDFKYLNPDIAKKYSFAEDYPQVVKNALSKMVSLTGKPCFDDEEILRKGVVVRHLCLPSHTEDSKRIIQYVYEKYAEDVIYSIMSQYTPFGVCNQFPEINRPISKKEYDEIIDFCLGIGIEDAYIQDGEASSESFIPSFNGEGVIF